MKELIEECRFRSPRIERRYSFEWWSSEETSFPLINHNELGDWNDEIGFFPDEKVGDLGRVTGIIKTIAGPERGIIVVEGIEAFFVPGAKSVLASEQEFIKGRDEGIVVSLYLGFSLDGLRAWRVRRDIE